MLKTSFSDTPGMCGMNMLLRLFFCSSPPTVFEFLLDPVAVFTGAGVQGTAFYFFHIEVGQNGRYWSVHGSAMLLKKLSLD